jgi:hypothetical protein
MGGGNNSIHRFSLSVHSIILLCKLHYSSLYIPLSLSVHSIITLCTLHYSLAAPLIYHNKRKVIVTNLVFTFMHKRAV